MATNCTDAEKKLAATVDRIHSLPTPPLVFAQIIKAMNDPDTSAYKVASIISEDPALTAKILKLTNSSFYGIPRTVSNVKQAIVILGMDAVKSLVISASVFDMFSRDRGVDSLYISRFWRHSLAVACMARAISRLQQFAEPSEAEAAFSAGLLHDIGRLVVASFMPDKQAAIAALLRQRSSRCELEIEAEVLGFSHAQIGSFLAIRWNLPERIWKAIEGHHDPDAVAGEQNQATIHLSDYLAHRFHLTNDKSHSPPAPFHDVAWSVVGMERSKETELVRVLESEYSKAETFLKVAQGEA